MNPRDFSRRVDQVTFAIVQQSMTSFEKIKSIAFWEKIPGIEVIVRWPAATKDIPTTDPNEHYRAWLEENCGKQTLDWDWKLKDSDIHNNQLTIRFKRRHRDIAVLVSLMWG